MQETLGRAGTLWRRRLSSHTTYDRDGDIEHLVGDRIIHEPARSSLQVSRHSCDSQRSASGSSDSAVSARKGPGTLQRITSLRRPTPRSLLARGLRPAYTAQLTLDLSLGVIARQTTHDAEPADAAIAKSYHFDARGYSGDRKATVA
jgi:hypothetical protein